MKMRNPWLLASFYFLALQQHRLSCKNYANVYNLWKTDCAGQLEKGTAWSENALWGTGLCSSDPGQIWPEGEARGVSLHFTLYLVGKPSDIISLRRAVGWKVENFVREAADFIEVDSFSFICILHQTAEWDWWLKQPEALQIVSGWGQQSFCGYTWLQS